MVAEGTYRAKIADYGISKTGNGNPQVWIKFSFKEGNSNRLLTYYGGFGDTQSKHTLKALVVCGVKDHLDALADGPKGQALDQAREVEIVVEHDEYNGKTRERIRWVNAAGAPMKNQMSRDDAKHILGSSGLLAELASIRQEVEGRGAPAPAAGTNGGQPFSDSFDLPF